MMFEAEFGLLDIHKFRNMPEIVFFLPQLLQVLILESAASACLLYQQTIVFKTFSYSLMR